ncbi:MAG: serine acetyltransferase [Ruminococcaceae bacterium]|nr:serine acetyltransferase [Oscillospiraceae bacterium]
MAMQKLIDAIREDYQEQRLMDAIEWERFPDRATVNRILSQLHELVFFRMAETKLEEKVPKLFADLYSQLAKVCPKEQVKTLCKAFLNRIPAVRAMVETDLAAAFEGDPAATGYDEIVLAYPGIYAITVYRLAHELYTLGVPLIPRMMTEAAHSITGIDIHPGATIGARFFIDHGTGIVIGQTTVIGEGVKLYQGVTLGGLSTRGGQNLAGVKRHPTIEDGVTIYAGATILGGETVIGSGCVIGANAFVTRSIPANTTVIMKSPELLLRSRDEL